MCPCAQVGGLRPAAAVGPGLSFLTGQRSLPTHSVKNNWGRSSTPGSHLFAVREQSAISPAANLRAGTKVPISAPSLAKLDYQTTTKKLEISRKRLLVCPLRLVVRGTTWRTLQRCAMTKFALRNQRSFCSPWTPRSRIFEFLNKRVRGLAS